jgi:hypothetical protein
MGTNDEGRPLRVPRRRRSRPIRPNSDEFMVRAARQGRPRLAVVACRECRQFLRSFRGPLL